MTNKGILETAVDSWYEHHERANKKESDSNDG